MESTIYDHYIAIDWSIKNMAIARMTSKADDIKTIDVPSDLAEVQTYLKNLRGTKILAIEETTTSQWLYAELKDHVDRIFICDPCRNRLLSEGSKTDKIDAAKLVCLLRGGLLKEVYHSADRFLYLRHLVSGYEDLVKMGVRLKNQRSSLLQACGRTGKEKKGFCLEAKSDQYVLSSLERQVESYEKEKKGYEKEFGQLVRKYPDIRNQTSLPGIGAINAVKIVARVVTPHRFSGKGHYLSYTGLIKLARMSGGRSYGQRTPRYCRQLKCVYKTGALAVLQGEGNTIQDYYHYLIREKGYPEYQARHATARRLAILSWGVFKSGKKYQFSRRNDVEKSQEVVSDL